MTDYAIKPLFIQGTQSTPTIDFNPAEYRLEIRGESYPENSFEFYKPILSWIESFLENFSGPIIMEIKLTYLNTSSMKCLMDIFDKLEYSHRNNHRDIMINWYYNWENDRAVDMAEEFKDELTIPFNIIQVGEECSFFSPE